MALGPLLYQFRHPYHWLAYGQNASIVGLIELVFYTIYTRRMMLIAQQTKLRELYPVLILQQTATTKRGLDFLIVNVGNGALLNANQWGMKVSEHFRLGDTFLERPTAIQTAFAGTMVSQATLTLHRELDGVPPQILEVVDGADTVGGRHQFCIVRSYVGPGNFEHQVRMIHPAEFLPMWRRVLLKLIEWRVRFIKH